MRIFTLIFLFLFFHKIAQAEDQSLCDMLRLTNCEKITKLTRRSSAKSLPSTTTAAQFNPANVSHDRGIGIEGFYQSHNSISGGIITGTGRTGAAMVSTNAENSFFGNRIVELDPDYLKRRVEKKQYDSKKYSLAIGAALIKKQKVGLDVGLMMKYNTDIKNVNYGGGVSLSLGFLTFGASMYKDDLFLVFDQKYDYRTERPYFLNFNQNTYQESFDVYTYSAGFKMKNLYLDWVSINTNYNFYQDEVKIHLYSIAYLWKKFFINVAKRKEETSFLKYDKDLSQLVAKREDNTHYGSIQYSLTNYAIIGAHYNYFLLNEFSASLALFF